MVLFNDIIMINSMIHINKSSWTSIIQFFLLVVGFID